MGGHQVDVAETQETCSRYSAAPIYVGFHPVFWEPEGAVRVPRNSQMSIMAPQQRRPAR